MKAAADVLTAWHKIGSTAHGSFHLLDTILPHLILCPKTPKPPRSPPRAPPARDVFEWPALELTQSDVAPGAG